MTAKNAFEDDQTAIANLRIAARKEDAAHVLLVALKAAWPHVGLSRSYKDVCLVNEQIIAAIAQAEAAGIKGSS